jgi:branched-chain amino acid transport system permease protein
VNWPVFIASILTVIGIFAIVTVALDLQFSYGNLINFGIVAYVAVGAYAYAIITQPDPLVFDSYLFGLDLHPIIGLVGAAVAGLAFAGLTAWPALRLRGDFLAIMTLAFAEVLNILLINEEWLTNGLLGFSRIDRPFRDSVGPDLEVLLFAGFILALMVAMFLLVRRLATSAFGKVVLAVADDEMGAAAIGKDVERLRLQVFLAGGAIMGLAGALYAMYLTLVTPEVFPVEISFIVWIALVLGGVRTRFGALLGVAILFGFQEATRFISFSPGQAGFVASLRLVLTGALLIVVLRLRPPANVVRRPRRRQQKVLETAAA